MNSFSTDKKEIRKFGIIAFLFFGVLFALAVWRQKALPTYFFGFLWALGIGFMAIPGVLRPVYTAWMKVAHRIGQLFTLAVLALTYYLVITPSAWIKRLFGGPPLPLRPDKNASTYWVTRSEPAQPKERFIKRY